MANYTHRQRDEYLYFLCSVPTARFRLFTLRLVLYDLQAAWITHAAFTCSVEAYKRGQAGDQLGGGWQHDDILTDRQIVSNNETQINSQRDS